MTTFRIPVEVTVATEDLARRVRNELAANIDDVCDSQTLGFRFGWSVGGVVKLETCDAIGYMKDGTSASLIVPMPAEMKAKEIVATYFGRNFDVDGSDAGMALGMMKEMLTWLNEQGRMK